MTNNDSPHPSPPGSAEGQGHPPGTAPRHVWHKIRNRLLEGLVVILPFLVTFWVIHWLYKALERYVIDPLAMLVIWKGRWIQGEPDLPPWFENYAAPVIAILVALVILYGCGVLAHSRLRRAVDEAFLRVPVVSHIYDGVRGLLKSFEKPAGQATPQRVVLVSFPHHGMRLPAIVTSTSKDVATGKTLLCVYVPTAPVPGSGFVLIVPEEEAYELNWDLQQTLQAIFSGGLTAPPNVTYYSRKVAPAVSPDASPSVT
jgi:uncharacterized membrane protein